MFPTRIGVCPRINCHHNLDQSIFHFPISSGKHVTVPTLGIIKFKAQQKCAR